MDRDEAVVWPAANAEGTTTEQPERALQLGDSEMVGAAPPDEKKGITGRVKDMMRRRGRKKHNQEDAAAKGGVLHKIKAKASSRVGHGQPDGSKHGPARLLSMSSSESSLSSSDEENIGTVGFAMDPTGPAVAGATLGRQDFSNAPDGPGAHFNNLTLNGDEDALARHSERAAEYAKASNPMHPKYGGSLTPSEDDASLRSNPHLTPNDDAHGDQSHPIPSASDPHVSNSGVAGEHHGNGPRDETVKEEGFVHRILNKVH